ncbi:hypothetical protein Poly30_34520 [Planctomycetes bacterium Poly30]|uniref:HlyD family efflux transporter periplasmic adaptor subunit n=1 Tax=Saltatorellus ferox TaxID=2528018 RepID=A0A518EV01_9BACT|nr:hypothetical protein Poly30_34520 [Planctomycetes bacterium Poly30]
MHASPFQQTRIHKLDTKAVKRREREIWLRRFRRAGFLVFVALVTVGAISTAAGTRIVADGLVRSSVVTLTAPAQVRVGAWAVRAGGSVEVGDALVELTPTVPDGRRAELRAAWDASLAQLAWFDAGGELEASGHEQRVDRVASARRSEALELAESRRLAQVVVVRREEYRLAEAAAAESRQALTALEAADDATETQQLLDLHRAELEARQAKTEEARASELAAEGLRPRRVAEDATAAAEIEAARLATARAGQDLADVERTNAMELARAALEREAQQITVSAARIAEAEAGVAAARGRAAAWASEAAHHEALGTAEPVRPEAIRSARRARLEADVRLAEAAYRSHVQVFGDRTLLAATAGVVDEILVLEGSIVGPGTALARFHDSASCEITIFASPSATSALAVGDPCSIHCPADGRVAPATIHSIGHVWIDAPEQLGRSSGQARVAVTLTLDEERSPFSANARIKAAFQTDRWTALKQRVLGWFQR